MKVAILTGTFSHFSGIDRVVYQQAQSFRNQGHQVTIIALQASMKLDGVTVLSIGMPRSTFWQRVYRLCFFIDRKKLHEISAQLKDCQEVYSHQYPMNLIARQAQKRFGVRYVYYNHGIAPPAVFHSLLEKIYIWLFIGNANRSILHADRIVSVSHYLAGVIETETGRTSEVQHNTIDISRFHTGISGDRIRSKLQLGTRPVILYVGRISPHKGLHLLVEAFQKVLEAVSDAQLLIVGKETFGGYGRAVRRQAGKHIHFIGFVSDDELPEYYAAANVYATASLWEGFDLPVAEAQAVGTPVVAFDIGPHREIMNDKGTVVPGGDIDGFGEAILDHIKPTT